MASTSGAYCAIHPMRGAVATCDHCGTFACADCISVQDGRQICRTCLDEGRVKVNLVPWEDRERLGLLTAAWQTIAGVSASPSAFFARMSPTGSVAEAAGFAALIMVPLAVTTTAYGLLFGAMFMRLAAELISKFPQIPAEMLTEMEAAYALTAWNISKQLLINLTLVPLFTLFFLLAMGSMQHAVLSLLGGKRAPLEATLRTALYSCGVRFWEVIPLASMVTFWWMLIVQGLGLAKVHETGSGKGLVAAWAPMLTCCCCILFPVAFAIGAMGANL